MRITIRAILIATTIASIPIAISGKLEYERMRAERVALLLQMELEATRNKLDVGLICENQRVVDYLAMAKPCETEDYGRYSEFQHGFPGGLGHGITIVSKDGRLILAYSWSCMGGEEFFNGMTEADSMEFAQLRSWAHLPRR